MRDETIKQGCFEPSRATFYEKEEPTVYRVDPFVRFCSNLSEPEIIRR